MLHVEVTFGTPFVSGDMPQAGTDQHKGRLAIRKGPNDLGTSLNLAIDPFQSVVGSDPGPMFCREAHIGEGFFYTGLNLISGFAKLISRIFAITALDFSRAAALSS